MFFTVDTQAVYFGLANLPAIPIAFVVGTIALLTKNRNHVYSWMAITAYSACGFHVAQAAFIIYPTTALIFPYLQFVRTIFFIIAGFSALMTLYYIFRTR